MEFQFICTSSSLCMVPVFNDWTFMRGRYHAGSMSGECGSNVCSPCNPYNLRFAIKRAARTHVHIKLPAEPEFCGRRTTTWEFSIEPYDIRKEQNLCQATLKALPLAYMRRYNFDIRITRPLRKSTLLHQVLNFLVVFWWPTQDTTSPYAPLKRPFPKIWR